MNPTALFGAGAVPLIAGIIQIFKATGVPARLAPLIALTLGLAAGLFSAWQTTPGPVPLGPAIVLGITWGLAASGLYQGGKLATGALRLSPSPYAAPGSKPSPAAASAPPPAAPAVSSPDVSSTAPSDTPASTPPTTSATIKAA